MPNRSCIGVVGSLLRRQTVEIRLKRQMVQEVGHRAGEPPAAANLKPAEVATQGSGQEDSVGVQLELFKGNGFLDGDLSFESERALKEAVEESLQGHQWS